MARAPMPDTIKRSRSLGVRVTPEQYAWLRQEAQQLSDSARVPVTTSAIIARLISEAMEQRNA